MTGSRGFGGALTSLAWSPDGQFLAASDGRFGVADHHAYLWNRQTQKLISLIGHIGAIHEVAWSPDGQFLATGSADETVRLWTRKGTLIQTLKANAGTVFKVVWSPDGTLLTAGSVYSPTQNTVQLWRVKDWALVATMHTAYSGGKFYNLGWSPDGKYLVVGATSYTEWRADGTEVFIYLSCASCAPAWGFAWSPDSTKWAIGNENGDILMFNTEGQQTVNFRNSSGNVDWLAWSPDGAMLAGGRVMLWNPDGKLIDIHGAEGLIDYLAWSPDSQHLAGINRASNAPTNKVFLWNRIDRELVTLVGHEQVVTALAWSPDGTLLASGSLDRTIRLWVIGKSR